MPLPGLFALRIPFRQPSTPREHEVNLDKLDRWASDLPIFVDQPFFDYSLATWSTGSSVYVDFQGGGVEIPFSKFHPQTDIRVDLSVSCFKTGSGGLVQFGVRVNSTDPTHDLCKVQIGTVGAGAAKVLSSSLILDKTAIRTGDHTITLRCRVSAGTLDTDGDCFVSLVAREVISVESI